MFANLFGSELPLAARFFIAFLVVLALIGLTAWLVRRFGSNRLGGGNTRGRQPRLAVIDAAPVDGRRRLVLIRRDNVEHLLIIGGPTDVVVEQNIVRAVGATTREQSREAMRVEPPAMRASPSAAENGGWPLQPANEPAAPPPPAAPRTYRSPTTEEPWLPPEPGGRARPADNLTGLAAELSARLNPPEFGPMRSEPPRPPVPPPHEPALGQNDHNLAEMAQQLEAALRRPGGGDSRPPVTDPLAIPPAPKSAPREIKPPRVEPRFDAKAEPKPRSEPPAKPGKALYDNLEDEMASLLGRPSGKT